MREAAVEHRYIVMMIPGRENVFRGNLKEAGELGQSRPLVVIGMAKAEIDGVALIMKFRLSLSRPVDEFGHAIQLFFILGHEAFQTRAVIKQARLGFSIHKIDYLCQDRLRRMKQFGVLAGNALIPISKRLPSAAIR